MVSFDCRVTNARYESGQNWLDQGVLGYQQSWRMKNNNRKRLNDKTSGLESNLYRIPKLSSLSTLQQYEYAGKKCKINASHDIMSTYREIKKNYLRASKGRDCDLVLGVTT